MKKISFYPFYKFQNNNIIFDNNFGSNRDNILEPYIKLKEYFLENNIQLDTNDIINIKESDGAIFLRFDPIAILDCFLRKKKSIYIQFEPPVVKRMHSTSNMILISGLFDYILTWNDDLVREDRFIKYFFPVPSLKLPLNKPQFQDKKFLTNISSYKLSNRNNELYTKRIEAIRYFEKEIKHDFEFYGFGWDKSEFATYKGEVNSKHEVLKNFKFSLCFENEQGLNGLISEKIFDCFISRTVPIYFGAENIDEYIPDECYIDFRKFKSYDKLLRYLKLMSKDEYDKRIDRIESYLISEQFINHSSESFSRIILEAISTKTSKRDYLKFLVSYSYLLFFSIVEKAILFFRDDF